MAAISAMLAMWFGIECKPRTFRLTEEMPYVIDIWVTATLCLDLKPDAFLSNTKMLTTLAHGMRMAQCHMDGEWNASAGQVCFIAKIVDVLHNGWHGQLTSS